MPNKCKVEDPNRDNDNDIIVCSTLVIRHMQYKVELVDYNRVRKERFCA
jgi:hypothetical protein